MAADTRNWAPLIRQFATQYGVDPRAALAVAQMEGLSGGVGDGGHAFGPFQMNDAGGVLTNRPGNHQAYAESPTGIRDAVAAMSKNARGLTGAAAVRSIVNSYERPANPQREIAGALARYGGKVPAGGGGTLPSLGIPQSDPAAQRRMTLLSSIFARDAAYTGMTAPAVPQLAVSGGPTPQVTAPSSYTGRMASQGGIQWEGDTSGVHPNLLSSVSQAAKASGATRIRVTSGFRSTQHNAAVGGVQGSNHTTGDALDGEAYVPGQGWVPLGALLKPVAGKYGIRSGDVPGFFNGNPDPVHVDDGANVR